MQNSKTLPSLVALFVATAFSLHAQDPRAEIRKKLESVYTLTQPTGALDDIVTAGSVLVIKKGPIEMVPTTDTDVNQNTYKDGVVKQNGLAKTSRTLGRLSRLPGMSSAGGASIKTRTFVPGEKIWLTGIAVNADNIVFSLFTDAFSDVRYKAALKFQFAKGTLPTPDQAQATVAEVFGIQPAEEKSDDKKDDAQQKPAPAQPSQPAPAAPPVQVTEAAPPPIAPPPPPADQPPPAPKTVGLGQTPDQVTANFGQPQKILDLGAKKVYVYPDMKVTFLRGKVSDVQ